MALLQIAEPGQSASPHQHRLVAGIDLGTTHSLVATVRSGLTEVIPDDVGRGLLPSVVRYSADGSIAVGWQARDDAAIDPLNTILSAKRMMGRELGDLSQSLRLPYELSDTAGMVKLKTVIGEISPVEVSAEILRALRVRAEESLGGELTGVVITVPAYFDDAQRQATKDAAKLAGMHVLRLLNEPTAAAIAYGLDNQSEGIYCVYDLGGGTFDFSILRLTKGVFEVLATDGDSALGGDDFDQAILSWLIERCGLASLKPEDTRQLLNDARLAKERLTDHEAAEIRCELSGGKRVCEILSVDTFATMTAALVARTFTSVRRAMEDANLTAQSVQGVVLVGGATRMPHVARAVEAHFQQAPLTNLDPDKVVALGAAIQANALAGNASDQDLLLLDVTPLSLGIETMGGLAEKIISRNSTLPCARAQDFTTFKNGQTAVSFHVVQGERELVSECRSLARFELRGIPPMVAGAARIRVTFEIDVDGLLSVSAFESTSGLQAHVEVKPAYGLTESEITRMLSAGIMHSEQDKELRALREAQVEARQLLDGVQRALSEDGHALLTKSEWDSIHAEIFQLGEILETGSFEGIARIRHATSALNLATSTFANRRMDASVRRALQGKAIGEIPI